MARMSIRLKTSDQISANGATYHHGNSCPLITRTRTKNSAVAPSMLTMNASSRYPSGTVRSSPRAAEAPALPTWRRPANVRASSRGLAISGSSPAVSIPPMTIGIHTKIWLGSISLMPMPVTNRWKK